MFKLKVHVELFELIQLYGAYFQIFRKLFDFFPFESEMIDKGLYKSVLLFSGLYAFV